MSDWKRIVVAIVVVLFTVAIGCALKYLFLSAILKGVFGL